MSTKNRIAPRSVVFPKLGLSLAPFVLAGCAVVGSDYEEPQLALPAAWQDEPGARLAAGTTDLAQWWQSLGDPALDRLVERALSQGLDLRAALARVRESRALRGVSAADRWPTIDATGSWERRSESKNTQLGTFTSDEDIWSAGFDAAWELDVWGRVRRSVEAADADLAAELEDARDVAVTVAAETAANYVQLRAFQRRLEIARTNVELQESTLALVHGRYSAGLVGERDVAQAMANVEFTRSRLPAFEIGVRAAENRLAVLLGLAPGALRAELGDAKPIPVPPEQITVGVPADLLRKRADVRRAERTLAAEHARIGVAEGDLYPRLSLLGRIGVQSDDPDTLFEDASNFFGFGPSLRWNLFDAGRLRNRVKAQDARAEQAYIAWERTVLGALEEAENAMTGFMREQTRRNSLLAATTQSRRAVELARTQYQEGLTDFQAVVDSERALADLEDQVASSDAAITTDLIALYKALGGGLEHEPIASAIAVARSE